MIKNLIYLSTTIHVTCFFCLKLNKQIYLIKNKNLALFFNEYSVPFLIE